MSVLAEALSVILRCDSVEANYPGGIHGLRADCPNSTFCTDGLIARVGFLDPRDVGPYIERLKRHNLAYERNGRAIDLAVTDQYHGLMVEAEWLECFRTDVAGHPVTLCCLRGTKDGTFAAPDGWQPGAELEFTSNEDIATRLTFLRHEGGNDVYRDNVTGELRYVGRASGKPRRFWRNPVTGRLARVIRWGQDEEL